MTSASSMATLPDIEKAVSGLSKDELGSFRDWFITFDADRWDRQLEEDVEAGRLDALADEALADLKAGRCTDL